MEVLTIVWFDSNCKDKDNSWNSKIKPRNFKGKVFFLPCFYSSLVYLHCPFAYLLMSKDSSMMNVLCSIWWVICILLMMWLWNYNQLMDLTEFISRILLIWNSTTMANVFEAFAAIVVLLRFCCCTTIRCCHYSQQMCWLQSADLLTRLSRAAEPSDKLREAVFSYPRRSIRCPEKLSPLTRYAISVSLFNHILLLNQPYSLAC